MGLQRIRHDLSTEQQSFLKREFEAVVYGSLCGPTTWRLQIPPPISVSFREKSDVLVLQLPRQSWKSVDFSPFRVSHQRTSLLSGPIRKLRLETLPIISQGPESWSSDQQGPPSWPSQISSQHNLKREFAKQRQTPIYQPLNKTKTNQTSRTLLQNRYANIISE